MEDYEVPPYFLCPISLEVMEDPVTTVTGITYDRKNIEEWLFTSTNGDCPVSRLPLSPSSDLIPNRTLQSLIRTWYSDQTSSKIEKTLTLKPSLDKFFFIDLMRGLALPESQFITLNRLQTLAAEDSTNRQLIAEADGSKAMVIFVTVDCYEKRQTNGVQEALNVLRLVGMPSSDQCKLLLEENDDIVQSLVWILTLKSMEFQAKSHAIWALKDLLGEASSGKLQRLDEDFYRIILEFLRERRNSSHHQHQGVKSALQVLLDASRFARNRTIMVTAGTVFELIELELQSPCTRITELVLSILVQLCSCADGRADLVSHMGGIPVIAEIISTVSRAADNQALAILLTICKCSGDNTKVLKEMLGSNVAKKLCVVLQSANGGFPLEKRAREILKCCSKAWKHPPCFFFTGSS